MNMNQLKALIVEELNSSLSEQEISAQNVRRMKSAQLAARDWISKQPSRWHTKSFADKKKAIEKKFPRLPGDAAEKLAKGVLHIPESESKFVNEELTKTDKAEIKSMISKELDKSLKKELKKALEDEISKALNSKATKEEIGEITKKVIKRLYKDLSFHHPYIIDRIKV